MSESNELSKSDKHKAWFFSALLVFAAGGGVVEGALVDGH